MSKIEVNKVGPQCGTTVTVGCGAGQTVVVDANTVTLGRCDGTVSLASGATQSGFGRTGTVDWVTTIQTSTITAANGSGYFVNTTAGAITANLPAGSSGSIVAFRDYANTFDTNKLTISSNGSEKINGGTLDLEVTTEGESITLVYADATKGWLVVNDGNNDAGAQAQFVTATGGTITTVCTDYKVHTFTGPGTFCVSCAGNTNGSNTISYMVIAGGGGGGTGCSHGAGGGAGGYREGESPFCSYTQSPLATSTGLSVSVQGYPIVVGGGGAGATSPSPKYGACGSASSFSTISSAGGGAGGGWNNSCGKNGGSGSGSANNSSPGAVGSGNTPPVSPPQGQNGGPAAPCRMGGGGGAGEAGNTDGQGHGGDGVTSSINSTPTARAGGGGGAGSNPGAPVAGGDGGGGFGAGPCSSTGGSATVNTGGGGGGSYNPGQTAGSGGSGIVIIRYKFQ